MIKDIINANETVAPNKKELEVLREHFPACFAADLKRPNRQKCCRSELPDRIIRQETKKQPEPKWRERQ